jgi:hypothetical protein
MTMVRSVPVGIWVDQNLRARFPDLRAAQEQAIRRQVDTQAQIVSPQVREDIPATGPSSELRDQRGLREGVVHRVQ